ncbi:MAG: hypothetical protein PHI34_04380 [Acidobacteriota bacterium]|nr:hypothetical protein [Acidobacteriota bacterium]
MSSLGLGLLSFFLSVYSTVPRTIEQAFLENDAGRLASLFSNESPLLISLPEPLSFSDLVSREQAALVFERIFRSYPTFEFYPESGSAPAFDRGGFILKVRWSFSSRSTSDQKPLRVFLRLKPETRPGRKKPLWAIVEIRAEPV